MQTLRRSIDRLRLAGAVLLAAALAVPSSSSLACGYHDDVTLARGMLNWIYPDALHVAGAISTAIAQRRLPLPAAIDAGSDLFGRKYRSTTKSLERVAEALRPALQGPPHLSLALVLVEPMLWTRFEAVQDQPQAQVHAAGPRPGDLVLVSGEVVMTEISEERLTIREAHRLGLIRLYGPEDQKIQFFAAYENNRSERRPTTPITFGGESP